MPEVEKVLVLGNGSGAGAREDSIIWASQKKGRELFCAPGNAGTRRYATTVEIDPETDTERLVQWAYDNAINLTIPGPEDLLKIGIVDQFQDAHLRIFGPTQSAAQAELSKIYSARLLESIGIAQPKHWIFEQSKREEAEEFVQNNDPISIVLKGDGVRRGKNVVLPKSTREALSVIDEMMQREGIVIQEKLVGEEVSAMALVDGQNVYPLKLAKDYKRLIPCGPNTGGVGGFMPIPKYGPITQKRITNEILVPVVTEMRNIGTQFIGILYAGLMITQEGPKVLEINVRGGDPETELWMVHQRDDPIKLFNACLDGNLKQDQIRWYRGHSACVVLTSEGYPIEEQMVLGDEIRGLDRRLPKDTHIFHGGTKVVNGKIVTSGGRVLAITARAETLPGALNRAYRVATGEPFFRGSQYCDYIGSKYYPRVT